MKNNYTLTLYEFKITHKKGKEQYALRLMNITPGLTEARALYLMKMSGYSLTGDTKDQTAKEIYQMPECLSKRKPAKVETCMHVMAYRRWVDVLELVSITRTPPRKSFYHDRHIMMPKIVSYGMGTRPEDELQRVVDACINKIDNGTPLDKARVDTLLDEARLSYIPKGWERVTEGTIEPGDYYLQEYDRNEETLAPGVFSWYDCGVSYSPHRIGKDIQADYRYWENKPIIIRKRKNL